MSASRLDKLFTFLEQEPNDPFLKYAIATEYLVAGNIDEALNYYLKLTKEHEDYVGTYYHLAKLYESLSKFDEAISTYEKGIEKAKTAKDNHALSELQGAHRLLLDELEE